MNWRLLQLDEALEPSTTRLQDMRDHANATEAEANRPREYALPDQSITALTNASDFRVYRTVAKVPDSVRSAFANAAHQESFLMADPNGRWEPTDVIRDPNLPRRRLASVAIRAELCVLFYEHGGIGRNDNVAAFRMSGDHANPIWHAYVAHHVGDPVALAKAVKLNRVAIGKRRFF
jgi:hypothetical protein